MPVIKTALISAYNKDGLDEAAKRLVARGIAIWASGGTANFLKDNGIAVRCLEEITGFSELLGGRVKTLHPAVFSGILARHTEEDMNQLMKMGFPCFDLVFVDLYPFMANLEQNKNCSEMI